MALQTNKEAVMGAVSSLNYKVFRNGQFHWASSETPDMLINDDGSIHCWTGTPFNGGKSNHGDLIDFILLISSKRFADAKKEAYDLVNLPLPDINSYEDNGFVVGGEKKTGFIPDEFIAKFEVERKENFNRFKELLDQALPSLDFENQKKIAKKYNIGYSKQADRLIMPIRDEHGKCITLWKYNKNPEPFLKNGKTIQPSKVTFTKGRDRCPFNLSDLLEYRKDKDKWIFLVAGEKDTLNGIGHGLRAFTLGAENVLVPEKYLPLLKDMKVVICYDYDKAGYDGVYGMKDKHTQERNGGVLEQIRKVAKTVKVWDWELLSIQNSLELFEGYDLTDFYTDTKR